MSPAEELAADAKRFSTKLTTASNGTCLLWTGGKDRDGYGRFWRRIVGNNVTAHVFAYELAVGPVPPRFVVMHRCDTPACCFAGHLIVGTPAANRADSIIKGRDARGETHWSRTQPENFHAHVAKLLATGRLGGPQRRLPLVDEFLVADTHPCGTSVIDPPLGSPIVVDAGDDTL